ncbi:MAG: 2-isopropylmalate synthase [Candidatus Margulisbacteria bacterium]|nr:2-isopropylmalate synthase [Candidatus Margulisiibacteriota bacterium]MBU1021561.1 2-isopropylmalate synthase [Candidatus Margulisiibacteriota bacterium]MBU1728712.1 2-isopropylmalate synthase [Candidatus Margulisiibacteriota bacterium]MBU1955163.1 2-isopropylmalate synthase [Candidatus Margulisiibacteriota bacterium]
MTKIIKIFDTTLRDGEQCPGASLNTEEKLDIARQLARLNVDVIEAGFAIASPGDLDAIQQIARTVKGPYICSLARCKKADIEAAWEAVKDAEKPMIHTFIATSPIHMEKKLRMKPAEVLERAVEMVKLAKSHCAAVEFSCEDASRSDPEFLYKIIEAVIDAGTTTVNIPDTVGYTLPDEYGNLIKSIIKNVPNMDKAAISVHCHNDLGLGVANSLAAVKAGATQVECTINGIGERAGNASLEEIVMAIKTRNDFFGLATNINTKEIYKASRLVSNLTGLLVQPNKAIVGANAFAHEAGIHQHGVMCARETYEIMDPSDIGLKESKLVLGKHSGRSALKKRLEALGYKLSKVNLEKSYHSFIKLADKKKDITDRDLESIVSEEIYTAPEVYKLKSLNITAGTKRKPSTELVLIHKGKTIKTKATGSGPVDATYKAVKKLTKTDPKLVDYVIQAITGGTDAQGEVTVRLTDKGRIFVGHGADTDILVASAKAYLAAINRLVSAAE